MKTIYKYKLPVCLLKGVAIQMLEGAEIMELKVQLGIPCMWALVDVDVSDIRYVDRKFIAYPTGYYLPQALTVSNYIGTYQKQNGMAFHIFEEA